jgi:hypothetical protein
MSSRRITSAQRLAAKALGATLPEPEADLHAQAEEALSEAAGKPPRGWSSGGPKDVIKAARIAAQVRRGQRKP